MYKFLYKTENLLIFIPIILLLIINISLLYSCSEHKNIYIFKTIIHIIIGLILIIIINNIKPKYIKLLIFIGYIFSLILLLYVNIFEKKIKGSKRWITIFKNLRFQPSEFSKIFNTLIISYILTKNKFINRIYYIYLLILIIILPSFLIILQPDLGTSFLVIISGLIPLYIFNIDLFNIIFINFNFFILLLINLLFMKEYQKNRIYSLFFYKKYPYSLGYNIIQSKIAIGSGGLFGKGLFKGTQSLLKFIPEYHTDFVFSVFSEKFGLLGVILLITIYLVFIINLIFISINNSNSFSKMVIFTYAIVIFVNTFINISMVIGILPIVGIPLPLLSYGGTFLITFFIKIGIIILLKKFNDLTIF